MESLHQFKTRCEFLKKTELIYVFLSNIIFMNTLWWEIVCWKMFVYFARVHHDFILFI